jgi:hypothetical protein
MHAHPRAARARSSSPSGDVRQAVEGGDPVLPVASHRRMSPVTAAGASSDLGSRPLPGAVPICLVDPPNQGFHTQFHGVEPLISLADQANWWVSQANSWVSQANGAGKQPDGAGRPGRWGGRLAEQG